MSPPNDAASGHPKAGKPGAVDWGRGLRWFGAEFLVVVTGVLVALALQAWYENRRDTAREKTYLTQLQVDLRDTERLVAATDSLNRRSERAVGSLMRAFYLPQAPQRDSVLIWFLQANSYELVRPVTATAEALITTGDLNLIRDDSIRTGITAYLDGNRRLVASQQTFEYEFLRASDELDRKIDYVEIYSGRMPQAMVDSIARANPLFPLPPGPSRPPFPVDTDAFLRDRDAHFSVGQLLSAKRNMADIRKEMLEAARNLREVLERRRAPPPPARP